MHDRWTIRIVVGSLALLGIIVVLGGIWLSLVDRTVPDALIAIGSGAVGALGGILSRSPLDAPTGSPSFVGMGDTNVDLRDMETDELGDAPPRSRARRVHHS